MDRSNVEPRNLAELAAEIVRQLRAQGADVTVAVDGTAAAERAARDEERRRRDEDTLRRDADQRRERLNAATLEHVLPPKVLRFLRSGRIKETDASKAAQVWFNDNVDRVLILRGPQGTGKTNAAGLIVKSSVERGKRGVSWHRPNDFVSAVLHQYDDDAPELGTQLVVIDDMGQETKADFALAMTMFLDDYGARLIITTNDLENVSAERYADTRLMERFKEDTQTFELTGPSMRGAEP
jgi:DNA replication protein DnaC